MACADSWTLVDGDFISHPVLLMSLDANGVKVSAPDGSDVRSLSWDSILELDHTQPQSAQPAAADAPFSLHLNGGDCISGTPLSIADDVIIWQHALLGRLEIPEDRAGAIVRQGQTVPGLDEARKDDSVRLVNGDSTSGVVQGMTESSISIQAAGADAAAQIGLDKVAAILLADPDPLAAPPPGSSGAWRVWLEDGSSLTVPLAQIPQGDNSPLTIGFSAKHSNSVATSAVTSIEPLDGPVKWLTELSPTEVVYHPFLEENFPPRFDHPVDDPGETIRSRFPPFRHGIGVHSYTRLTYAVPDGFRTFRAQFGIERIPGSDMTKADVTVRLLLDGKVAREFTHVRYGSVAPPVLLDVSAAKELALEVDYGDNLDAQDRFVWLDPAFVRSSPATQPTQ